MTLPTLADLNLDPFWMPFTANRQFKQSPRLLVSAAGMYYRSIDGREILDGTAGLWCVNAGHCRPEIVSAIAQQAATLDFAPTFQMGHPGPFQVADCLRAITPDPLNHVFFANSGSEAVDTALKIALAYHRLRGEGTRQRLIGRERGYHGVGFGGISVGGIAPNRKFFGSLLAGVDHLPHTHNLEHNAFSKGQPAWGAHLADELERLVALHDASTIAAVIVEPLAGSTGVLIPPQGYLERLRAICDRHGILLIFDEVITGFGRLGAPFASQYFGVTPDLITVAKGLTNAAVPMGAVIVRDEIYDTFMQGPAGQIEFFHGYTYSGHPLACAAALATLEIYEKEALFERAASLAPYWQEAIHSLRGLPHVIDIRNLGLVAGIELAPREGQGGARGYDALCRAFEAGLLIRVTGDIIALSPPLIVERSHIDQMVDILSRVLRELP
ncbi:MULTISPECIES: aspartate aminotransferase family protein [unclassified Thermosynechococcus]|uniref:aspartate aminotransferase family protein n=1 Tax=unclassified Thermosynechococcus TaxID=2622553 RepID=UPI0019820618|nr:MULTISPECIES: aspartate aminotransferase family protein [unclassified Thermosynechococcus]QSF48235.1 aspartate aminotransferase family protein [Thermosynechococcus sp. TA-1]WNC21256.1 aspartate aminotransferase family protein [Thermosynechococcus sp. PP22]WNC31500.1 aspartate aminotransferase family protein [Thermosynechococcus sp. PKX95]WNC34024.1 aspartate aminotransferase family protein [Thermosynechococcus sp. PKX91]WNC36546.1 aspartate aminotransferase family protein [Thermosynechococc